MDHNEQDSTPDKKPLTLKQQALVNVLTKIRVNANVQKLLPACREYFRLRGIHPNKSPGTEKPSGS